MSEMLLLSLQINAVLIAISTNKRSAMGERRNITEYVNGIVYDFFYLIAKRMLSLLSASMKVCEDIRYYPLV